MSNKRPREDREEDRMEEGGSLYVCLEIVHLSFYLTTAQDFRGGLAVSIAQAQLKFIQSVEAKLKGLFEL